MPGGIHKTIAADNEAIIETGSYAAPSGATVHLKALVDTSRAGTRSYSPPDTEQLLAATRAQLPPSPVRPLTIEVTCCPALKMPT